MTEFFGTTARQEAERKIRVDTFDKFVDLALDGVIELPQAIKGYKEEMGIDEKMPKLRD